MTPSVLRADARDLSTLEGWPRSEHTASQTEPRVFSMSTYAQHANSGYISGQQAQQMRMNELS